MRDGTERDSARRAGSGAVADAFVERIAAPLRAVERLDESFEARVLLAVHSAARAAERGGGHARTARGSWRRRNPLAASPLARVAMAAGLLGITIAGAAGLRIANRTPASAAAGMLATRDSVHVVHVVHVVRFELAGVPAASISLVGDFNGWTRNATRLVPSADGRAWAVEVALPAGRHEYAFIVRDRSGERWVADPRTAARLDEFGTESSIVQVGADADRTADSTSGRATTSRITAVS